MFETILSRTLHWDSWAGKCSGAVQFVVGDPRVGVVFRIARIWRWWLAIDPAQLPQRDQSSFHPLEGWFPRMKSPYLANAWGCLPPNLVPKALEVRRQLHGVPTTLDFRHRHDVRLSPLLSD